LVINCKIRFAPTKVGAFFLPHIKQCLHMAQNLALKIYMSFGY